MRIFKLLGARAAWLAMRTAYQTGAVVAATRAMHTPTLAAIIAQRDEARAKAEAADRSAHIWKDIAAAHVEGLRVATGKLNRATELATLLENEANRLRAALAKEKSVSSHEGN